MFLMIVINKMVYFPTNLSKSILIIRCGVHKYNKMAASEHEEDSFSLLVDELATPPAAPLWDPLLSRDWDNEKPKQQCILRIKRCVSS